MVGFDSTILPGREGKITPEVNLSKAHAGTISKCVTVTSNAKNKPEMHLCLDMTVRLPLSASPDYIQMRRVQGSGFSAEITLSTEKQDLVVKEASFKPNAPANSQNSSAWTAQLPDHLEFTITKESQPGADGAWNYKLKIDEKMVPSKDSRYGEFTILTNHPEIPELKVNGVIDGNPDAK